MSMIYDGTPALYSDAIFSLLLYFNIEEPKHLEPFINPKKRVTDIKYYRDCIDSFDTPPEELAPFYVMFGTQSFAFSKMYDYISRSREYSIESLRAYLPDADTMMNELFHFYAPEEIGESLPSAEALVSIISLLETSALVKYHLLAMSMNPSRYYQLLFESLEHRIKTVKAYHKEQKAMIDAVKKVIDEEEIRAFLDSRFNLTGQTLSEDAVYSVMVIGKNAVRFVSGEQSMLILGVDYSARMAAMMGEAVKPDIVKMGKALSEEKRVTALHIMLKEGEVTAQQLLKALDLSMTATHYHLEMLLQAGMLSTRNVGRTIYYSVNREYFDRAPLVFEPFNSHETDEA